MIRIKQTKVCANSRSLLYADEFSYAIVYKEGSGLPEFMSSRWCKILELCASAAGLQVSLLSTCATTERPTVEVTVLAHPLPVPFRSSALK